MRIALLQMDIAWERPAENFARVDRWLPAAEAAGARLLLLPELFAWGFSMNAAAIAEPPGGPATRFLLERADRHGLWLGASIPERPAGAALPANTFLLVSPGGDVHRYAKRHPFTFAREHEHYAGGGAMVTVEVEGLRCTPFVCYDLRFADDFWARAEATDCYLVVANWPARRRAHWTALLAARAIENQAYVAAVNRVGEGDGVAYAGDSRIIDPWGETLAAGAAGETLLLADLDPARVADARARFPVLRDRRPPPT